MRTVFELRPDTVPSNGPGVTVAPAAKLDAPAIGGVEVGRAVGGGVALTLGYEGAAGVGGLTGRGS